MSIREKLLESKAERARYHFTNKAIRNPWPHASEPVLEPEKGVHISLESDKKINVFLPTEDALKMFIALRDSLRGVIAESSNGEKLSLQVLAERDAWGLERFTERKSHVAEDLGL